MADLKISLNINATVNSTQDAHEVSQEIENRLFAFLQQLLPNLPRRDTIKTCKISFDHQIEGRQLTLEVQSNSSGTLILEDQ